MPDQVMNKAVAEVIQLRAVEMVPQKRRQE
jgi:hypothetical protein